MSLREHILELVHLVCLLFLLSIQASLHLLDPFVQLRCHFPVLVKLFFLNLQLGLKILNFTLEGATDSSRGQTVTTGTTA